MALSDSIDRLKSQLLTSGLQKNNSALFQVINQLIGINSELSKRLDELAPSGGSGTVTTGQTLLTLANEQATLPNSRRVSVHSGVTMMTNGQQTFIGASPIPMGEEGESTEGMMGPPGPQGTRGPTGASATATIPLLFNEESEYQEPPPLYSLFNAGMIPETAIIDGSILARVASTEVISGFWTFGNASPNLDIKETTAPLNEKIWRFAAAGSIFNFLAVDDALATTSIAWLLQRSGVDVTAMRFQTMGTARTLLNSVGTLDHRFALQLSGQSAVTLVADQTAWNPTGLGTAFYISVSPNANGWIIRGITAQAAGTMLVINNPSAFTFNMNHEDGAAVAANRIRFGGAASILVTVQQSYIFTYDGLISRWVNISRS